KQELILTLLSQPAGASIQEMMQATNWQQHSVRGFLAGTVKRKLGFSLNSEKRPKDHRGPLVRPAFLRFGEAVPPRAGRAKMRKPDCPKAGQIFRCAFYTRKSSDDGLEQEFNSLDAQREACEAYVMSQRHAGWITLGNMYDDGGRRGHL